MRNILVPVLAVAIGLASSVGLAGGALACDNYGHMCAIPGNYNCVLIPPIHGCSQSELSVLTSLRGKIVRHARLTSFESQVTSFTIQVSSRNDDYKCEGGLEAAQVHANGLCHSKASIRIDSSQCLPASWNPKLNIEIIHVTYQCN